MIRNRRVPSFPKLLLLILPLAFAVFSAWFLLLFFSMLLAGRLQGSLPFQLSYTVVVIDVFLATQAAFISLWQFARCDYQGNLTQLTLGPRPEQPLEASAWWWGRVSIYCGLAFALFCVLGIVVRMLLGVYHALA